MTIYGVDYSWDRPDLHCLAGKGYRFVCRYLSYDTTGKNLTAIEAGAIHAAGLDLVLNWEFNRFDALNGHDKGGRVGRDANIYAEHVGAPGNSVIYFSADFNVQPDQLKVTGDYFRAINDVIGPARVGVYGGIRVVDYLYTHGLARWLWQTYAWSGSNVYSHAHVYQYSNGHVICGARMDLNRALKPAFGQWAGAGSSQIIATPPPPQPPTTGGFDYTGDIRATAASLSRLRGGLDAQTSVINALRGT